MASCKKCHRPIEWLRTKAKPIPYDPDPVLVVLELGGDLRVVIADNREIWIARKAKGHEPMTIPAWQVHFDTCSGNFTGKSRGQPHTRPVEREELTEEEASHVG